MLTNSFTLLFYLKKRSNYNNGPLPIYMRLTIDGQRIEITTKRQCDPEKWNSSTGRKNGLKDETKVLNVYLDMLQRKVYEAHHSLLESKASVTVESIKGILTGVSSKPKLLLEIFQKHNEQLIALVGKDYAPGTIIRYNTSLQHTRDFIKWKYKTLDIDILKLNFEFISDYEFWLKSVRKCNHNTAMRYLVYCKKIVLNCFKNGWLQKDPFIGFKMTRREVNRTALTDDELDRITKKEFSTERLAQVRDIFLFSCYTGLAYVDVQKLKLSEIIVAADEEKWLITNRQKTDSQSRILLLPQALNILERYKNHPHCVANDRLLPVLSNQKTNAYLKEIAAVCGIDRNISFHIARHTFATTVTLSNGVPIESVSKMLGHTNIKTTQIYAKIVDRKISDDMKSLRKKLAV